MAKKEEGAEGQSGETSSEGKTRKKRSPSKFQLVKQLENSESGASRFEVVAAGTSVGQMTKQAAGMDDGKYAIISVRAVVEVKTETQKTVNKIK